MAEPLDESPFKGTSGIRRILNALGYSLDGLRYAWKGEAAFRQVVLLVVGGGIAVALLKPPLWATALILMSHLLCVIVELVNSAIEAAVDHTSLERHELAKRAKDLGSAAQLVSLLMLCATWGLGLYVASMS